MGNDVLELLVATFTSEVSTNETSLDSCGFAVVSAAVAAVFAELARVAMRDGLVSSTARSTRALESRNRARGNLLFKSTAVGFSSLAIASRGCLDWPGATAFDRALGIGSLSSRYLV